MTLKGDISAVGTILSILLGGYGTYNSWRANKRLDETDDLVLKTRVYGDGDKDWFCVELIIYNERGNSIFIEEIRPSNFKQIIPEKGQEVNSSGMVNTVYDITQSTYKRNPIEILGTKYNRFNFKVPHSLDRMKLVIFYSYSTTSGLKKASRVYEHII